MKFGWSTLMVRDLDESLRFYEEIVGLRLDKRFKVGPGTEIAFLGEGETKIELICDGSKKRINAGEDISWGFVVESLDETLKLVREKGVEIHSGPFEPNPGIRFFYVLDPNGMKIQFAENH